MSLSNSSTTTVNIHDSIEIPSGVAAAFNRSLKVLCASESFVDRCYSLGELVNQVIAWRWSDTIDKAQCSYLLRKIRKTAQDDLGNVANDEYRSAREVYESEAESEELTRDLEQALRSAH